MDAFTRELAAVERSFTLSTTQDEKVSQLMDLLMRYDDDRPRDPVRLHVLGNGTQFPNEWSPAFISALMPATVRHGVELEFARRMHAQRDERKGFFRPPLMNLPCANTDPNELRACDSDGTRVCSACRLVSYCSPGCQKQHWKRHKEGTSTPRVVKRD